jgi:hypothetical protein
MELPVAAEEYLRAERVCRVASSGPDGIHLAAAWFLFDDGRVWLHTLTSSRRWRDLTADPRAAVIMDTGDGIHDYRGVEFAGAVDLGAVAPAPVAEAYHRKYRDPGAPVPDAVPGHAWAVLAPDRRRIWGWI